MGKSQKHTKDSYNLVGKKKKTSKKWFRNGQNMWIDICPKRIHRQPTGR